MPLDLLSKLHSPTFQVVMRQFPVGRPGSPATCRAVRLPYAVLEVKLADKEAPQPPWLLVSPALPWQPGITGGISLLDLTLISCCMPVERPSNSL